MDRPILNPSEIARALRTPAAASSDFDLNPGFRPPPGRRLRPASVLVPLVERGGGLRLILTRRAALLRHHPGQVAFPGGKQDPEDPTPLAAALREAREEIGLDGAAILGELPSHETVTGFVVTPFVGLVAPASCRGSTAARSTRSSRSRSPSCSTPANFRIEGRAWQGQLRHYYVVPWGPHYIWGATARMLRIFADRMRRRREPGSPAAPWLDGRRRRPGRSAPRSRPAATPSSSSAAACATPSSASRSPTSTSPPTPAPRR